MRNKYTFQINQFDDFKEQLLAKSKKLDYISILDSNTQPNFSLPENYIQYELIAGVGMLANLITNDQSFNKLRDFHERYKDWMFGYLSYDLKNEEEDLVSENFDGINAPKISFFIPQYVFLLKGDVLEVETNENKNSCEKFLLDNSFINKSSNTHISLKRRETKSMYLKNIKKIKEHIQRGDIYEMNYCQEFFSQDVSLDAEAVFYKLNRKMSTPFSSFSKYNNVYVICASPERFIKKINNKIISQPIKGTRKRGLTHNEDKALHEELRKSKKDISENIMITDLVRNDLSITAAKKSVDVSELCKVYTFNEVHQMITTITSEIEEKTHFIQVLRSVFPMGSMTGVPKLRAMRLIEEMESFKRGIFSGATGYITPEGDFDFNVVIRTIIYDKNKRYLSLAVGGAITISSDPEDEYQECIVKAKPIFEVLKFKLDDR